MKPLRMLAFFTTIISFFFAMPAFAGVWTTKTSMVNQRDNLGAVALNGIIYAMGGAPAGISVLSSVEAYDPATDIWTAKAPMQTQRYGLSVATVNGVIYAIGGTTAVNGSGPITTMEAYAPATDTWSFNVPGTATPLAGMPTPRWGFDTCVVDGIIYAIGGSIRNAAVNTYYGTVEAYDPVTNTWTTKAPMPTPRYGMTVSVVNGLIYAIGGWGGWPELSVVEIYDPATDTWSTTVPGGSTPLAPMPTARDDFGYGVVNGVIYAIGGDINAIDYTTVPPTPCCTTVVESYDTATNTWATETPMPTMRDDFDAIVVNGVIYGIAGSLDGNATVGGGVSYTTLEAYTISDIPTPTGVTATVGSGQVSLSWNAVSGAASYNIYWSTKPGVTTASGTKITGATSPYVHTASTAGKWYYYVVTAVTVAGESLPSDEVSAHAYSFAAQTGAPLNSAITSDIIRIIGANAGATISIAGGTYSINGGAYVSTAGTVNLGDTVSVQLTSSANYSTTTTATLTIGGVDSVFDVTTANLVTAVVGAGGTVTPPSQVVGNGVTRTFTVTPDTGYTTDNAVGGMCPAGSWSGAVYTTGAITGSCSVSFTFSLNTYTLSYAAGAHGSLTGAASQTVSYGGAGSAVTAVPFPGYHFVSWSDASVANPRTDSGVTGNLAATANFASNNYTVTPSAGGNGTIAPATPQTATPGSTVSFNVMPNVGYTTNATVGGTCATGSWAGDVYTTGALTGSCSVSFSFTLLAEPAKPGFHSREVNMTVNIKPAQVATDGGKWSLDGGSKWYTSGQTVSAPSSYTITFKTTQNDDVTPLLNLGWRTPRSLSGTTSTPVTLTIPYQHVANDYDKNGKSDILFRNGMTGDLYAWDMTGPTVIGGGIFSTSPGLPTGAPGVIIAQADFDGDGRTDLLFENSTTKALTIWIMNCKTVSSSSTITITPARKATEVFAGVGDFNGDGKADILLIDTKPGNVSTAPLTPRIIFNAETLTPTSTPFSLTIPQSVVSQGLHTGWHVAAIADFDGDGKADILWRFANPAAVGAWIPGMTSLWYMNGATRISAGSLPGQLGAYSNLTGSLASSGWLIVGTGDFSADGYTDILYRNGTTGQTFIWLLHGKDQATFAPILIPVGPNAAIVGDTRGSGSTVDTNGIVVNAGVFTATTGWTVAGIGDFNGDGKDDVLWRYLGTGHTYVWTMDGRTVMSAGFTTVYPGTTTTWASQIMRSVLDPQ